MQKRDLRIEHGNTAIFMRYSKWTKRAKRIRERKKSHWVYIISVQVREMLVRYMHEKRSGAKRRDPVFENRMSDRQTYRNLYERMQKIGRSA